ncbi:hypothetical protein BGE01nite_04310 [Brevifollis gellanilyticus]|uniref:Uncharacterized protein n=1 Tax=Brevifollis gellanilyticus TaxID=748831 RepID=A0A512M331_9BACT|nr:hypothetical protein BGE01nite_04310 [Brevifollis gellanilyticus]
MFEFRCVNEPLFASGPRYQGFGLGTEPFLRICACTWAWESLGEDSKLLKRIFRISAGLATFTGIAA